MLRWFFFLEMMVKQKAFCFLNAEKKQHEFRLLLSKAWLVSLSVGLVGHEVATSIKFDSQVHEHLCGLLPKLLQIHKRWPNWTLAFTYAHLYRISLKREHVVEFQISKSCNSNSNPVPLVYASLHLQNMCRYILGPGPEVKNMQDHKWWDAWTIYWPSLDNADLQWSHAVGKYKGTIKSAILVYSIRIQR